MIAKVRVACKSTGLADCLLTHSWQARQTAHASPKHTCNLRHSEYSCTREPCPWTQPRPPPSASKDAVFSQPSRCTACCCEAGAQASRAHLMLQSVETPLQRVHKLSGLQCPSVPRMTFKPSLQLMPSCCGNTLDGKLHLEGSRLTNMACAPHEETSASMTHETATSCEQG